MSNLLASYYLKKFSKKNFIYLKIITNKKLLQKRSKNMIYLYYLPAAILKSIKINFLSI